MPVRFNYDSLSDPMKKSGKSSMTFILVVLNIYDVCPLSIMCLILVRKAMLSLFNICKTQDESLVAQCEEKHLVKWPNTTDDSTLEIIHTTKL